MATPFLGEIRMFAGNFAPTGWALCNGQSLSIDENAALFTLLGTTYGGDGENTFALPDLRSRIPVHQGTSYTLGQTGGAEQVQLTVSQIPQHTHAAQAQTGNGDQQGPAGGVWASSGLNQFSAGAANGSMNAASLASAGQNQAHTNIMPYLTANFIIALQGIFPSQN